MLILRKVNMIHQAIDIDLQVVPTVGNAVLFICKDRKYQIEKRFY